MDHWSSRCWFTVRSALAALALATASIALGAVGQVRAAGTVTVTTVADTAPGACATSGTGPCTLREAVIYGNAHPGTVINVPSGAYALSLLGSGESDANTGDLDIRADMTINGVGPTLPIIDGGGSVAGSDRVFDVFPAAAVSKITVAFDRLQIQNGSAHDNFGGGGIWSGNTDLTVSNSVLYRNTTSDRQGGAIVSNGGDVNGRLILLNTTLDSNDVIGDSIGEDALGGGVFLTNSVATIVDSTLVGNRAIGGPASTTVDGGLGASGGIYTGNTASGLILVNSIMTANRAQGGTAVGVPGNLGSAGDGWGGGAFGTGPWTIVNSSIVGNIAQGGQSDAGSTVGEAFAGGIENFGPMTLINSTIARNSARAGGGSSTARALGGGLIFGNDLGVVTNTIIAANTVVPSIASSGPDAYSGFPSGGHNLLGVREGGNTLVMSDLSGSVASPLDPKFADAIALNGGPTETLALLSSSPAVNAGDNAACALPLPPAAGPNGAGNVDQRGTPRPQPTGGQCDIGAFELTFAPSTTTITSSLNPAPVGQAITFTATVSAAGPVPGTVTIRDGATILGGGIPVGGVVTLATSGLAEGHHAISATYGGDTIFGASTGVIDQVVGSGRAGLQFYPLPKPVRLLDTRPDHAALVAPSAPLVANQPLALPGNFTHDGVTVPADAKAVVGNATVDNTAGVPAGFATIYPSGAPLPLASNLNFVPGTIRPNQFTVGVGTDGQFNLLSNTGGHFIIDVTGYYAPPTPAGLYFHALPQPVRLLDTRPGASAHVHPDAALTAGQTLNLPGQFTLNGATVPASAKALAGNATVDNRVNAPPGFATLFPGGTSLPPTSNLNFAAGTIAPNAFTVGLGDDGRFNLYSNTGGDFVLDVTGYYDDVPTGGLLFRPVAQPVRELDTRVGESASVHPNAPLSASGTLTLPGSFAFAGVVVPPSATALVGNATVDNTINAPSGFATLFPGGTTLPLASNLNYSPGLVAPNAFIVGVGADGTYNLFSQSGGNFIIDISGYFASS